MTACEHRINFKRWFVIALSHIGQKPIKAFVEGRKHRHEWLADSLFP